jgi:hypothetical protein
VRVNLALAWLAVAGLGLAGVAISGCRRGSPVAAPKPSLSVPIAVPTVEPRLPCADVGTSRVCWSEAGAATVVARAVPTSPASSPLGWRCAWPGPARLCVDRRADAPPFSCVGERCTQTHARRPDDGEWTCVDSAGAEICLGGGRAAGVAPAPADPAWLCRARRGPPGRGAEPGARVCVDLSPDFPDGDMAAWRCRAVNGPAPQRVCERGASPGSLGMPCRRESPCVDGARCAATNVCVPARPAPSCWLDDDCPGGACRFGTCRDEAPP